MKQELARVERKEREAQCYKSLNDVTSFFSKLHLCRPPQSDDEFEQSLSEELDALLKCSKRSEGLAASLAHARRHVYCETSCHVSYFGMYDSTGADCQQCIACKIKEAELLKGKTPPEQLTIVQQWYDEQLKQQIEKWRTAQWECRNQMKSAWKKGGPESKVIMTLLTPFLTFATKEKHE